MTDNNKYHKLRNGKQLLKSRFTAATWFIIAAAILGLFAVFILLYDASTRL
jgi:hypothetical protein